jgi:hypothetical protein
MGEIAPPTPVAAMPMIVVVPPSAMERKIVAISTAPIIAPLVSNTVRRGESIAVAPPAGPIAIVKIAAVAVASAVPPTLIVSITVAIHKVTISRQVAVTVEFSRAIQIASAIKVARAIAQVSIAALAEFTPVEIAAV